MSIEWTKDLSVGYDKIDEQHKELFKRINDLFDACNQGKGKNEVGNLINFLGEYVVQHFSDEEEIMKINNYPQLDLQKQEHAAFIKSLNELKNEFDSKGENILTVLHANKMVIQWLTNHICKSDKALGIFLKSNK